MRGRLSIGTVLLGMTLAALVLPLSGLWGLRLYESALIRQTESELAAQAGVVAAFYRNAWRTAGGRPQTAGRPVDPRWTSRPGFDVPWLPRFAMLDLAEDLVLPSAPDTVPAAMAPDPAAAGAGRVLGPILREAQRVTLAAMRVLDRRGVVVATTGEELGGWLGEQEEVRRALTGEPVSVLRQRTSKHAPPDGFGLLQRSRSLRIFVAQPVLDEDRVVGVVLLSRTPRTIADTLYGKRWHLAGLVLMMVVVVAMLVRFGAVAISRPLRAVTVQAKRTAEGERGAMAPLERPIVREVAELSEALTRMAATLEQRADYIRDFAAHVSHEFKTPLTTIRGAVELLRDHLEIMSDDERERFLTTVDAEAARLSVMVRRLLDLARADVMRGSEQMDCDAVPVVARVATRHGAEAALPPALPVAMGEDVLETILINLLDNARRHAGEWARVSVALSVEGGEALLRVCDDGPGISAANAERVFTPFFTTARHDGGTGLGLAIVRSLVDAHGGSISLRPSPKGAVFEVRLQRCASIRQFHEMLNI